VRGLAELAKTGVDETKRKSETVCGDAVICLGITSADCGGYGVMGILIEI